MPTLAQTIPAWFWLQHLPILVFVFAFGACVGSFLNVVIYRLPNGVSVLSPPSECPHCGARLRFFYDNLPILGWLLLRGRCRYCRARISAQYVTVELVMAMTFIVAYALLYMVPPRIDWWGDLGGMWWYVNGVFRTWPAYVALTFLLAGLLAMTMIDARTFTIPIEIPLFVTITAFIMWTVQGLYPNLHLPTSNTWPIPGVGWTTFGASVGGMLGVVLGVALLRIGVLRYSFADYEDYLEGDETIAAYPHARREMRLEVLFLLPVLAGIGLGWFVASRWAAAAGAVGGPPVLVQAVGASLTGYLVGAAMIWGTRILGTLGFGKEAMGLGDVHLLGAVGAVLGWLDPIIIFFIAPFTGLAWHMAATGVSAMFRRPRRELPYGPHLAAATVVLLLCRPGIEWLWTVLSGMALPQPGLVP